MGLAAGVVLVVVGLSGSCLAFYTQIDRALNPDWVKTGNHGEPMPMQRVLDAARSAMPDRFLHSVFPPKDAEDVHHVWFTPSAQDQGRMWEVLVDPFDGQVLGQREAVPTLEFTRRNLVNTIYTLHFQLFMGQAGATLVGWAGLFLLISGTTGLVLWWPRGGRFRTGLMIKRGTRGLRFHFDLHRALGIYSLAALIVVACSGVCMTFPSYVKPLVALFSPVTEADNPMMGAGRGAPIDADHALALARARLPGARVACLWLPGASGPAWRVSLREPEGIAWAGGPAEIWLHPEGGSVLASRRHREATAGDAFLAWQLPLHGGSAFGLVGRIVVCLLGFVPLLLAMTGISIWRSKLQARRSCTPR